MIQVNIHQAKTNLSHYIDIAQEGEQVFVCKRNIPKVILTPVNKTSGQRKLGTYKHKVNIPDTFFEPLPDDILESFENPL